MNVIDDLGFASAKAQSLRGPITTLSKLKNHPDQRIYVMREETRLLRTNQKLANSQNDIRFDSLSRNSAFTNCKYSVVGMIKVGIKSLFVLVSTINEDEMHRQIQINPLCVLDFYIDERLQRQGTRY